MIDQEGKYHGFMYRFLNGNYKDKDWVFAFSRDEIETQLLGMNSGEDKEWQVEIEPVFLRESQISKIAAMYLGSHKSEAKSKASRENGKKGGRPRKGNPD
jgi:hypothetical protein